MCSGLLSFSFQVLLSILFLPLFVGALHIEVDCWWPWGRFIFYSALLWWSRSFGPRGTSFCFPYCGCSHLCEVGVVDLRGKFVFYSALLLVKSIFLTSRHEFNFCSALLFWWSWSFGPQGTNCCFPWCGCPHFVKSVLWTSGQIYFLRCTLLEKSLFLILEARSVLMLLLGSESLALALL